MLAAIHKKICGFKRDEEYIGTAEEGAKTEFKDESAQFGVGHMIKLPGFVENAPPALLELLEKNPNVSQYINSVIDDVESAAKSESGAAVGAEP